MAKSSSFSLPALTPWKFPPETHMPVALRDADFIITILTAHAHPSPLNSLHGSTIRAHNTNTIPVSTKKVKKGISNLETRPQPPLTHVFPALALNSSTSLCNAAISAKISFCPASPSSPTAKAEACKLPTLPDLSGSRSTSSLWLLVRRSLLPVGGGGLLRLEGGGGGALPPVVALAPLVCEAFEGVRVKEPVLEVLRRGAGGGGMAFVEASAGRWLWEGPSGGASELISGAGARVWV